jgi:chemotaxis protein methyltransferase CheR
LKISHTMTYSDLTEKEFLLFQKLVYDKCGINLHEGKKELVRARLGKRLREHRFTHFKEYYQYLMEDDAGEELILMLDAISTNLTSFFREPKHFDFLKSQVLPGFFASATTGFPKCLNLWSAGCSSGEEPYTLSICLREFMATAGKIFDYKIAATDISTKVLTAASAGVYGHNQIQTISGQLLRQYFQQGRGKWHSHVRIKPEIRKAIEFRRFNLMDPFPKNEHFHVIFCRNVMIYFDKKVQEKVVNKFYDALVEGGYLFIGHSESLMGTQHRFQYIQPTIYRK